MELRMISILNRWTGTTIWSGEAEHLGAATLKAVEAGTDLSNANLTGAKLRGANLTGAPVVPVVPDLDKKIAETTRPKNALKMSTWHTCHTTHCRAGWAIVPAGDAGAALEQHVGSAFAGTLIYLVSTGRVPNFYASNKDARVDIKRCATAPGAPLTNV